LQDFLRVHDCDPLRPEKRRRDRKLWVLFYPAFSPTEDTVNFGNDTNAAASGKCVASI
jgi:hypothetical protein